MKIDVLTIDNKKSSVIDLDNTVFGAEVRADILHRMITWQLAKKGLVIEKPKKGQK